MSLLACGSGAGEGTEAEGDSPDVIVEDSGAADTGIPDDAGAEDGAPNDAADDAPQGLTTLYIGHSFGRPFAEQMEEFADGAGVIEHTQAIVSRGGQNGAPQNLWDDSVARAEIDARLAEGDVDVLVMICCSESFLVDGTDVAIDWWVETALEYNPSTRIVLALPWPDFPEDYDDAASHGELWPDAYVMWENLAQGVRERFDGVEVDLLPHGLAALDLRERLEADALTDISLLRGDRDEALFTDAKGHAGQMLLDVGTLIWVATIYDIDLAGHPIADSYSDDVVGIAEDVLAAAREIVP